MRSRKLAGRRASQLSMLLVAAFMTVPVSAAPTTKHHRTASHHAARVARKHKPCNEGVASFYAKFHQGRRTADGERFDMRALTAAHRSLPFGTKLKVTNLRNGKSLVVRVNDRGPYSPGRIIDVTREAARQLGFLSHGVTDVRIEPIEPGVAVPCK